MIKLVELKANAEARHIWVPAWQVFFVSEDPGTAGSLVMLPVGQFSVQESPEQVVKEINRAMRAIHQTPDYRE